VPPVLLAFSVAPGRTKVKTRWRQLAVLESTAKSATAEEAKGLSIGSLPKLAWMESTTELSFADEGLPLKKALVNYCLSGSRGLAEPLSYRQRQQFRLASVDGTELPSNPRNLDQVVVKVSPCARLHFLSWRPWACFQTNRQALRLPG